MAGITKDTPNPTGGTFDKDANGELNGRVTDLRVGAIQQGRRQTHVYTAEQTAQRDRDGMAYISKQFVRYGLTSVHHEGGNLAGDAGGARARRSAVIASATKPAAALSTR